MPPCPKSITFIDEDRKIESYESLHRQGGSEGTNSDFPGRRILCAQGMFVWMTMAWDDLVAEDNKETADKPNKTTECVSEMVSLMVSLIYQ